MAESGKDEAITDGDWIIVWLTGQHVPKGCTGESLYRRLQPVLCEAKHMPPDHDCTEMISPAEALAAQYA